MTVTEQSHKAAMGIYPCELPLANSRFICYDLSVEKNKHRRKEEPPCRRTEECKTEQRNR